MFILCKCCTVFSSCITARVRSLILLISCFINLDISFSSQKNLLILAIPPQLKKVVRKSAPEGYAPFTAVKEQAKKCCMIYLLCGTICTKEFLCKYLYSALYAMYRLIARLIAYTQKTVRISLNVVIACVNLKSPLVILKNPQSC